LLEIDAEVKTSDAKKNAKKAAAYGQYLIDTRAIDDKIFANNKTLTSSLELLWLNHFNNRKKIQLDYQREIRKAVTDRNIENASQNIRDLERSAKITDKNEQIFSTFTETAKTGRQFRNAKKRLKITWQEQVDNLYVITKANEAKLKLDQKYNDETLRQQGASDKTREEAWLAYDNKIKNLNEDANLQEQNMMLEQNQKLADINKQHREAVLDGWKQLVGDIAQTATQTLDSYISVVDAQLNATQRGYDRAKEIADKGNASLLEAEQTRMDKLNAKRRRFANAQKAIIQAQIIAEAALAVAKAAGQTGAGAPFAIASTIVALVAGFASAKAAADASMAEGEYAKGGYTGDGGKHEEAGTVHKGEFVFTKETTKKYRPFFEEIHKGRDPYFAMQMQGNVIAVNNKGVESRLERIEKAIMGQQGMRLSIDENGIHGIVSRIDYKQNRVRNQAR
jgi:hypothetical protein